MPSLFTPEELASMAAADDEIEETFVLTDAERCYSDNLNNVIKDSRKSNKDAQRAAYKRAYDLAHKEEISAYAKKYYESHKEYYAAYYQAHKDEHKDERRAYGKAWYNEHRDEILASKKAYRATHKDEINARRRELWARKKERMTHGYEKAAL